MAFRAVLAAAALAAAPAFAYDLAGQYQGHCTTFYGNAQPGNCPVALYVDWGGRVTLPADGPCFSPTNFHGQLYGQSVSLQSGGWQAQPRGQFLRLDFSWDGWSWRADGSGYGLSDNRYRYNCTFRKVW